MIGNTLGPDEAYRFARGETVTSSTGLKARLPSPLDFLVVADHAESIGAGPAIKREGPVIQETEFGRQLIAYIKAGEPEKAHDLWLFTGASGKNPLAGEPRLMGPAWKYITDKAEEYNNPGQFTSFIGFEWSSHPQGNNLHRVLVFRDGQEKAIQVRPISRDDTFDPEDVWTWVEDYDAKTGGCILAIPHNGNLSNGLMFDDVTGNSNTALDHL